MALRENRIWGPRERAFERVLPRLDDPHAGAAAARAAPGATASSQA